jgi:hypothetical protein
MKEADKHPGVDRASGRKAEPEHCGVRYLNKKTTGFYPNLDCDSGQGFYLDYPARIF